ncbi:MAG: CHASE2 domain-containing protein, partial [Planctomycetota bacterium]
MTSSSRPVVILGLILTLVVVGAALLGLLDALERETIDFRFTHIRWRDDPMSDEIRFVDIDDGALDSVGRWPWDRSTLADAIEELRLAGARTIALDILFDNPQRPDRVDHDAVLAEVLASVQCVLTSRAGEPVLFHPVWSTPDGRDELDQLLDTLSRDIQLEADEGAQQAGLTGPRHGRFRARPIEFKKAAADIALRRIAAERGEALTYAEFIAEVAPNVGEYVDAFPERPLLLDRWDQHQSWSALQPLLRHPPGPGTHRDKAPLPAFARETNALGYVNLNIRQDSDGELRSLPVVEPGRGGSVLQFGLAAAALHLGVTPDDLQIRMDRLALGDVDIPLT